MNLRFENRALDCIFSLKDTGYASLTLSSSDLCVSCSSMSCSIVNEGSPSPSSNLSCILSISVFILRSALTRRDIRLIFFDSKHPFFWCDVCLKNLRAPCRGTEVNLSSYPVLVVPPVQVDGLAEGPPMRRLGRLSGVAEGDDGLGLYTLGDSEGLPHGRGA